MKAHLKVQSYFISSRSIVTGSSLGLCKRNGSIITLPQDASIRTTRSFVRDGELLAAGVLVLATNEVGDLLVLGLLNGALVVLLSLAEEVLLDVVDACD